MERDSENVPIIDSPHYMAPEVLEERNDEKCDAWSTGVVLYEMVTGTRPFDDPGDNIHFLLENIKSGQIHIPSHVSPELADLLSRMIQVDPNERMCCDESLNHPFITKYNFNKSATCIDDNLFSQLKRTATMAETKSDLELELINMLARTLDSPKVV